jgi:hypothetical protein
MGSLDRMLGAITSVEKEILKEKASGLGRTAQKLEALLARFAELEREASAAIGPKRDALAAEHEKTRKLAETWSWYLCIQREALGLYVHQDVEALYPVPRPLPKRS